MRVLTVKCTVVNISQPQSVDCSRGESLAFHSQQVKYFNVY